MIWSFGELATSQIVIRTTYHQSYGQSDNLPQLLRFVRQPVKSPSVSLKTCHKVYGKLDALQPVKWYLDNLQSVLWSVWQPKGWAKKNKAD